MRIGIIAPEFPPDVGGVETYSYEFSCELARRGHDVYVFTRPHVEGELSGSSIHVLPELTRRYLKDRFLLKSHSMDVWHVMNAAYAWLALEVRPVVVSVHGNDFIDPYFLPIAPDLPRGFGLWRLHKRIAPLYSSLWKRWALRSMGRGLQHATHVIANSQYTKEKLLERHPGSAAISSVGYVGVGAEFFQMEHQPNGLAADKRFLTVCRLADARKNIDKILHALAQLTRFAFRYTIVGDGNLRSELEILCHQLKLDDRVHFTGFIPKTEMQKLLASSDLFILPSAVMPDSIEGFGIAYLEANACGTPVLAARCAGAAEAVDEGKTGYFVESPTVPALAQALEQFLVGDIVFKGEHCREFAARFTWAKVVDRAMPYYMTAV